MISAAWAEALTVAAVLTGGYAALRLARELSRQEGAEPRILKSARLVHLTQVIMSAVVIQMVWRPAGPAGTAAQALVLSLLVLTLAWGAVRSTGPVVQINAIAHAATGAAMVWMVVSMPLLPATGRGVAGSVPGGHHHETATVDMPGMGEAVTPSAATPASWIVGVTWVVIALMAGVTLWWLIRTARSPRRHVADLCCHALMSAGMAAMLALAA